VLCFSFLFVFVFVINAAQLSLSLTIAAVSQARTHKVTTLLHCRRPLLRERRARVRTCNTMLAQVPRKQRHHIPPTKAADRCWEPLQAMAVALRRSETHLPVLCDLSVKGPAVPLRAVVREWRVVPIPAVVAWHLGACSLAR